MNIEGNSVVNFCLCEPKAMFRGSVLCTESHTAEYMSQLIIDKIHEIGAEKIFALVTDNAANMKAAWVLVKQQFPHIICFGCAAHGLNLLMKDFTSLASISKVLSSCRQLVRGGHSLFLFFTDMNSKFELCSCALSLTYKSFFCSAVNNRGALKLKFKAVVSLKLPIETRWFSWLDCLGSLLKNRNSLEELANMRDEDAVQKAIKDFKAEIKSDIFWDKVETILSVIAKVRTV